MSTRAGVTVYPRKGLTQGRFNPGRFNPGRFNPGRFNPENESQVIIIPED
jgi:hypothetical protein